MHKMNKKIEHGAINHIESSQYMISQQRNDVFDAEIRTNSEQVVVIDSDRQWSVALDSPYMTANPNKSESAILAPV